MLLWRALLFKPSLYEPAEQKNETKNRERAQEEETNDIQQKRS